MVGDAPSGECWGRALLLDLTVALLAVSVVAAPSGTPAASSPFQSVWLDRDGFRRDALANITPELDQFMLGATLMPLVDPLLDAEQGARLRGLIGDVYGEMRQDPDFEACGSVMSIAYRDLLGMLAPEGHLWVYLPEAKRPLPTLLFVHGFGGHFKSYIWVLRELADRHGYAIVAPSHGVGIWNDEGGDRAIARAHAYIEEHPQLDGRRVTLVGLSNGGRGVSRAAIANPPRRGPGSSTSRRSWSPARWMGSCSGWGRAGSPC